jgi:hypothetical protein
MATNIRTTAEPADTVALTIGVGKPSSLEINLFVSFAG